VVGEDLQKSYDFLLDTGIVMRHLRNEKRAQDFLSFLEQIGEISLSAITYMEILVLCRPHEEESTKIFFERVPPLAVSKEVAHKAASLISKYPDVFGKQIGRGTPDALIAATAWQREAILVTLNTRQFAKVPIAEITICSINQNAKDWTIHLKL
jgi:predicted nucleic acid-binding protein